MKSLNKVQLIGRLATDVDFKETKNNNSYAKFSFALNKNFKKDGKSEKSADFFKVKAWNSLAKICHQYMKKGMPIFIDGSLSVSQYEDSNGITRNNIEIRANDINFLPSYNLSQKIVEKSMEKVEEKAGVC